MKEVRVLRSFDELEAALEATERLEAARRRVLLHVQEYGDLDDAPRYTFEEECLLQAERRRLEDVLAASEEAFSTFFD